MRIIDPSFDLVLAPTYQKAVEITEMAARTCYKSDGDEPPEEYLKRKIIKTGHHSVLEHIAITAKIVCDRGVSHELVRHRLASYSQSSTRYCNYSKDKFGSEITVVRPAFWPEKSRQFDKWMFSCMACETAYMQLIQDGASAQQARSVLPNSLATTVIITANIREWRHILKLRCSKKAHPDMEKVMTIGRDALAQRYPVFFEDLEGEE